MRVKITHLPFYYTFNKPNPKKPASPAGFSVFRGLKFTAPLPQVVKAAQQLSKKKIIALFYFIIQIFFITYPYRDFCLLKVIKYDPSVCDLFYMVYGNKI